MKSTKNKMYPARKELRMTIEQFKKVKKLARCRSISVSQLVRNWIDWK